MATTRAQLIQHVALRMDEVSPEIVAVDLVVDGSDGNPLYTLIDGLVDGGALELFSVAPYWRLPQKAFQNVSTEQLPALYYSRWIIRLKVADDFLRVAEISCTGFQRPITEVVPEMSEAGKRQHNRFLMGKEAKPVGVISHGKWGSGGSATQCREIDCYSLASEPNEVEATYIPKPTMPESGSASDVETVIPPVLLPALEWLIAARTFGARGDANHAAICQQNAQNVLV